MILQLDVILLASRADGSPVTAEDFTEALEIPTNDKRATLGTEKWDASNFLIASVRWPGPGRPKVSASAGFEDALKRGLDDAGTWLSHHRTEEFDRIRASGVDLEVLVTFNMDVNQMELMLPAPLLLSLGERGLPLHVISND